MKNIKEKEFLVNFARALGQEITDEKLLKEVSTFNNIKKETYKSIKKDAFKDLAKAFKEANLEKQEIAIKEETEVIDYPVPPTLDEVLILFKEEETINELVQPQAEEEPPGREEATESAPEPTLAERAAKTISELNKDSFQQPDPDPVEKNFADIQRKLKFLEQSIGKISAHGPGGGAGDVINLTHPVKLVTQDYTITRRDYYIGVNAPTTANIILPSSIGFPGRKVIIKDESGNCANNPIVVFGNVDNDPGGFILQQNNGAIQMIYREGWRII